MRRVLPLLFLLLLPALPSGASAAERIVSLSPALTEIVYALRAEDRLVGVSRQCDTPVAAKLKPKGGDFNRPHPEKLKELGATVVLFSEQVRPEDLSPLAAAGIRGVVLPARSVADVLAAIREIGELTGAASRAKTLAASIEGEIVRLREKVPSADRPPRVYLEVDGPGRLYAVGGGSFMSDLVRLAGGENVFAGDPRPYFALSAEEVVKGDPEVIVVDHPFQYKVGLSRRPGWSAVPAVRNDRIYDSEDFDMILLNRPGPRIAQALAMLIKILHPEESHAPRR